MSVCAERKIFGWREVLALLDADPMIGPSERGLIRNEGYYRSLAAEARRCRRRSAASPVPGACAPRGAVDSRWLADPEQRSHAVCSGVAPGFLRRGQGSHVWDVDGNEYIDYPMALGPIILGHAYPAVDQAVRQQMEQGAAFSLPHPLEIEVAERLVEMVPCAEMVRFGKNGSDATAGAVRLARAYTGQGLDCLLWLSWLAGLVHRCDDI